MCVCVCVCYVAVWYSSNAVSASTDCSVAWHPCRQLHHHCCATARRHWHPSVSPYLCLLFRLFCSLSLAVFLAVCKSSSLSFCFFVIICIFLSVWFIPLVTSVSNNALDVIVHNRKFDWIILKNVNIIIVVVVIIIIIDDLCVAHIPKFSIIS